MPTTLQRGLEEFWTAACIRMQTSAQWKNRFVARGWRRRGRVKSVVPLTEKSRVQGLLSRLGPQAGPRLRTNAEGFTDARLFGFIFVFLFFRFFIFCFIQFFLMLFLP